MCLMFFSVSIMSAQEEQFIKARLIDTKTDEPVVFATIIVKDQTLAVISNMDGSFQIPLEFKTPANSILISSMGYVSKEVPISELKFDEINLIRLEPALEVLDEVVVSGTRNPKNKTEDVLGLSADEIVHRAIKGIFSNYSRLPYSYIGYYRDYQLKDSIYINLNEALFEVFDSGFGTNDYNTTKTRIYNYRRNNDFQIDTATARPYDYEDERKTIDGAIINSFGGNEFMILRIHDPIRNHSINSFDYINILDIDFEENHMFKREADIILDNQKLFVVSAKKVTGQNRALGKLFISQDNFAIHKLEYALYRGGKKYNVNELYGYSKVAKDKFFDVQLEYKPVNDHMYLNYISVSNDFQVKRDPIFKVEKMLMNWDDLCYEVHFTAKPEVSEAINKKKYNLRFKGKKVNIRKVEVNNKVVRLFTELDGVRFAVNKANWKMGIDVPSDFRLRIRNLKDNDGNRLDEGRHWRATQFREFFVQQVKPKNSGPSDYLYMKKDRPIYKAQPIASPVNFENYWMNTPLQSFE